MNRKESTRGDHPRMIRLEMAFRILNKSLENFYDRNYEQAIQLCGEALDHLLPERIKSSASPEEKSDLFLKAYSSIIPVQEAEGIAGVFTFFQNRKSRFHWRRGSPLPDRDWWQFIRINRGEAEEAIRVSRLALNCISKSGTPGG